MGPMVDGLIPIREADLLLKPPEIPLLTLMSAKGTSVRPMPVSCNGEPIGQAWAIMLSHVTRIAKFGHAIKILKGKISYGLQFHFGEMRLCTWGKYYVIFGWLHG